MMNMRKPRTQRTAADWQQLLEQQQKSDMAITQFCEQHQLTVSNFYHWRNKLSTAKAEVNKQPAQVEISNAWQPVEITVPVTTEKNWNIELKLPGGVVLNMSTQA